MKKIIAILALGLLVAQTTKAVDASYQAKVYKKQGGNDLVVASGGTIDIESGGALEIAGTAITSSAAELNQVDESELDADGTHVVKVIRSTFDTQVDGGDPAAYDLGEDLPARAVVIKAWFQIITQFVDAGSGTVALSCEGANDLYSAADITGSSAGAVITGVPTGASATGVLAVDGTACNITATIATATQSAGKLVLWVMYVMGE